ncbi:MAG: signal recognition particle receptor subunit alpha, partial [Bacteroidota bacterium]
MFESLTKRIGQAIQKIKGYDKITASNIGPTLKEIRRALVEADVPYKVAKEFIQEVKEEALGTEVQVTISPGQLFT